MEEKQIDSWCIVINDINRNDLIKYFNNNAFIYTKGYYYGIDKKGHLDWLPPSNKDIFETFNELITTNEFYERFLKRNNKTNNKELNYEVWF